MSDLKRRLNERYPAGDGPFVWTNRNAWTFVYSNREDIRPLAIAFVASALSQPPQGPELRRLQSAKQVAHDLAKICGVPFGDIVFSAGPNGINDLRSGQSKQSEAELRDWFAGCGLQVNTGQVGKMVNRGMASAFSQWQRDNLGGIIITDIDLAHVREPEGQVDVIYELKRSHIPLRQWHPYPDDFLNFDTLSRVASQADAKFRILYNHYSRNTASQSRVDNASQVALFSYSAHNQRSTRLGIMNFSEFADGAT